MNHMASDFTLLVQPLFALANKSCTPCLLCFMIAVTPENTGPTHLARRGGRHHPPTRWWSVPCCVYEGTRFLL